MKLTIAFDDISPAAAPDAPARHPPARHRGRARPGRRRRRRRRPPHRRPRPAPAHDRGRAAPRRRRPGLRRLRAAAACSTTTTPRTPTTWPSSAPRRRARRSRSTSGRPRATCSSTSTSTSSPWTAAGSRTATGLASLPQPAPPPQRRRRCSTVKLVHGPAPQRAALVELAHGQGASATPASRSSRSRRRSTTTSFPDAVRLPAEAGVGVDATRPGARSSPRRQGARRARRRGCARKIFQSMRGAAPDDARAGRRGRGGARGDDRERATSSSSCRSRARPTSSRWASRTSARTTSNSIMNPILVMCLGLGYFFNLYRGQAARCARAACVIMSHPTPWEFHPVHHPSYIDFFEQVLAETTDPLEIEAKLREAVRRGRVVPPPVPHELRLPRRPPVLHVVLGRARHAALRPGDHRRRRPAGRAPARLHARVDAGRRARDGHRRRRPHPTITHLHTPPILMADVT